jgi:hypothetical protein
MPTTITTTTTTTTTEAVLAALGSGSTSAAGVAEVAGIGRSTATKVLAALAAGGRVERTPGGRDGARRLPDRWALPEAAGDPDRPGGDGDESKDSVSPRLGKGELAKMVAAFLADHPGEHTPSAVAKALDGRSAGAVGNALGRLVGSGDATQTSDRPRMYRAAAGWPSVAEKNPSGRLMEP